MTRRNKGSGDPGAAHLYGIIYRPRPKSKLPLGTGVGDPPAAVRVVTHGDLGAVIISPDSAGAADSDSLPTRARVRSLGGTCSPIRRC